MPHTIKCLLFHCGEVISLLYEIYIDHYQYGTRLPHCMSCLSITMTNIWASQPIRKKWLFETFLQGLKSGDLRTWSGQPSEGYHTMVKSHTRADGSHPTRRGREWNPTISFENISPMTRRLSTRPTVPAPPNSIRLRSKPSICGALGHITDTSHGTHCWFYSVGRNTVKRSTVLTS